MGIWPYNLLLCSWLLLSGQNELCPWASGPQGWTGASTDGRIAAPQCCPGAGGTWLFPLWQAPSAPDLLGCCVLVFLPWVREPIMTAVPQPPCVQVWWASAVYLPGSLQVPPSETPGKKGRVDPGAPISPALILHVPGSSSTDAPGSTHPIPQGLLGLQRCGAWPCRRLCLSNICISQALGSGMLPLATRTSLDPA